MFLAMEGPSTNMSATASATSEHASQPSSLRRFLKPWTTMDLDERLRGEGGTTQRR